MLLTAARRGLTVLRRRGIVGGNQTGENLVEMG